MAKVSKKQIVEINRLRGFFPKSITIKVERSQDGGFCVEVKTFPGCVTEANTFSELIEMVNDAVRTYFEVPERFVPYMPTYIPLIQGARRLDVFPFKERVSELKLETPSREKVAC